MPSQRASDNRRRTAPFAVAAAWLLAGAGSAQAQSASGSLSQFHGGYAGTGLSGLESPVNVSTRDANGDLVVIDGVISSSSGASVFASSGAGVAYSGGGGSAAGSASAIGNSLSVNVSGQYDTVIVNSSQVNTGAVSATTVLNGKVDLDGGP